MEISFNNTAGEWLSGSGPESDIVISSRIRLARNLKIYNFMPKLDAKAKEELESYIADRITKIKFPTKLRYYNLKDMNHIDRDYMVERHLISRDLAQASGSRGVGIGDQEIISIMVNEEDHLRIQTVMSGFQLEKLWNIADEVDDYIDEVMPFSFHPQYGYLTSCPTNVGTGLRVSVMLHLPGLAVTGQIEKVFYAVSKISLAVRGFYGEGSKASSDFYQISNQITLGKTENQLLASLKSVVPQIIRYEREARVKLFDEDKLGLEDKIHRALGVMLYARQLNQEECLDHLSTLRLGVNLGLLDKMPISKLNELFILSLPAHLQKMTERSLSDKEMCVERSKLVRRVLSE